MNKKLKMQLYKLLLAICYCFVYGTWSLHAYINHDYWLQLLNSCHNVLILIINQFTSRNNNNKLNYIENKTTWLLQLISQRSVKIQCHMDTRVGDSSIKCLYKSHQTKQPLKQLSILCTIQHRHHRCKPLDFTYMCVAFSSVKYLL